METVVRLRHVTMVYSGAGGTRALDDVSLDIRRGEVTLLMGPSGREDRASCPSSAGLLTPTSGEVWIADTGSPRSMSGNGRPCAGSISASYSRPTT